LLGHRTCPLPFFVLYSSDISHMAEPVTIMGKFSSIVGTAADGYQIDAATCARSAPRGSPRYPLQSSYINEEGAAEVIAGLVIQP
jgi:hypothetical protein